MKFFVPVANDAHHAEEMYRKMRERITHRFGRLTDKRIYSVKFHYEDTLCNIAVGGEFTSLGQPVLAIFEGESGCFVCTTNHGAIEGEPVHVAKDAVLSVEEFTSLA